MLTFTVKIEHICKARKKNGEKWEGFERGGSEGTDAKRNRKTDRQTKTEKIRKGGRKKNANTQRDKVDWR